MIIFPLTATIFFFPSFSRLALIALFHFIVSLLWQGVVQVLEEMFSAGKGSLHRGVRTVVAHDKYAINCQVIHSSLVMVRVCVGEGVTNCGRIGVGPSVNLFAKPLSKFSKNLVGFGSLGSIAYQGGDDDLLAVTSWMKIGGYVNMQYLTALRAPTLVEQQTCLRIG